MDSLNLNTLVQDNQVGENSAKLVPSVLSQTKAHESRTEEYSVIESGKVIQMFQEAGFEYKLLKEEKHRKAKYKGFGTHLIALFKPDFDFFNTELNKELRPIILFRNSYHGRTTAMFNFGLYRLVCKNGLMVGHTLCEGLELKHIGLSQADIMSAAGRMKATFNSDIANSVVRMKERTLSIDEQRAFASDALRERFRNHDTFIRGEHEKLLNSHREEDRGDSLWNVFQRVQENLGLNFRGVPQQVMYVYRSEDKDNPGKFQEERRKMMPVTGIAEVEHLNRYLFDQARILAG